MWAHHLLSFSSHPYSSRRTFAWLSSSLYPHWADASYRGQAYLYKLPTRCDVQRGATKGPATLYFNNGVWRCCNAVLYVALLYGIVWNSVTRESWNTLLQQRGVTTRACNTGIGGHSSFWCWQTLFAMLGFCKYTFWIFSLYHTSVTTVLQRLLYLCHVTCSCTCAFWLLVYMPKSYCVCIL